MSYVEVKRFHKYIQAYVHNSICIVIYIREPLGLMSSIFQQCVKRGIDDQIRAINYKDRILPWIEIFGRETVKFRDFQKSSLYCGSAVKDFCYLVGIPEGSVENMQVNESLSAPLVKLLYKFNRYNPVSRSSKEVQARYRLINTLNVLSIQKFSLHPQIAKQFMDENDISWMEEVSGFDLHQNMRSSELSSYQSLEQFLNCLPSDFKIKLENVLRSFYIQPATISRDGDSEVENARRLYEFFISPRGTLVWYMMKLNQRLRPKR